MNHSGSIQDYYFDVRRAVFGLCALWIVIGASMDWILVSSLPTEFRAHPFLSTTRQTVTPVTVQLTAMFFRWLPGAADLRRGSQIGA